MSLRLLDIPGDGEDWLIRAEAVHRQLRPQMPADYPARMTAIVAAGARMLLAVANDEVRGVAVWRLIDNTHEGRRLFVDDLVTDAAHRSQGVGRALLARLEALARAYDCSVLALDSGVQRGEAHKFYFREGMQIAAYSFRKTLQ